MGDGSSPREAARERGCSLPLTRPPNVDFFRESRSPSRANSPPSRWHHTTSKTPAAFIARRQDEMLRAAPASPSTSPMEQAPSPALDPPWSTPKMERCRAMLCTRTTMYHLGRMAARANPCRANAGAGL